MTHHNDLAALVLAARDGDMDAFAQLVRRFEAMARAGAYALLGDTHLAEDAAQEAFVEAYLCLSSLREPAAFPGWFRRIVFKQGDRIARRRSLDLPLDHAYAQGAGLPDPAALAERSETRSLLRAAVADLPGHERIVTSLFYLADYSQQEIAAVLGLPLTTIKKRLHDARRRLRERMAIIMPESLPTPRPQRATPLDQRVRFLIAVRTGDLAQVRTMLAHDQRLVAVQEQWSEHERSFYDPMWRGYTPLHRAVAAGDIALAGLLLEHGADVNAPASDGESPLHRAILVRRPELVAWLLANGADANRPSRYRGMSCLQRAIIVEEPAIATLLLDHGVDVRTSDEHGRGPLHWAAIKGYADLARRLIAAGADPSARDNRGRTPRDWAMQCAHSDVVALFDQQEQHREEQ